MEPLVSLTIRNPKPFFQPGEELLCEYQIDAIGENEIASVEASVLWYTEGKGEEDLGLHYFERRLPGDREGTDLRELKRFQTRVPNSPLSYDGELFKIRWCVRVRVFLPKGKEIFFELPFRLGNLERPKQHAPEPECSTAESKASENGATDDVTIVANSTSAHIVDTNDSETNEVDATTPESSTN